MRNREPHLYQCADVKMRECFTPQASFSHAALREKNRVPCSIQRRAPRPVVRRPCNLFAN
jgi:hypothetical protein